MKFTKVITAVCSVHILGIALLVFQPGCNTTTSEAQPPTAYKVPKAHAQETEVENNREVSNKYPERKAPTRPSWVDEASPTNSFAGDNDSSILKPLDIEHSNNASLINSPLSESYYTVQKGDSLWSIAKRNGIQLNDLLAANNMTKSTVLKVGQELKLPGGSAYVPSTRMSSATIAKSTEMHTYQVQPGDTLSKIAKQNGVTVAAIKASNNLTNDNIVVGKQLTIPGANTHLATECTPKANTTSSTQANPIKKTPIQAGTQTHIVQSGDTIAVIAKQYGIKSSDLMQLNNIRDPKRLKIGQELVLTADAKNVSTAKNSAPTISTMGNQQAPLLTPILESTDTPSNNAVPNHQIAQMNDDTLFDLTNEIPVITVDSNTPANTEESNNATIKK